MKSAKLTDCRLSTPKSFFSWWKRNETGRNGQSHDSAFSEWRIQRRRKKTKWSFQMAMLEPALAVLDETDSGLDIDALRIVANGVNVLRNKERSFVVITHYQRLLDYIVPDYVHVLYKGRIVKSGTKELSAWTGRKRLRLDQGRKRCSHI